MYTINILRKNAEYIKKLNQIKKTETNSGRANEFIEAFILGISWEDYQNQIADLEKITKQDIIDMSMSDELYPPKTSRHATNWNTPPIAESLERLAKLSD